MCQGGLVFRWLFLVPKEMRGWHVSLVFWWPFKWNLMLSLVYYSWPVFLPPPYFSFVLSHFHLNTLSFSLLSAQSWKAACEKKAELFTRTSVFALLKICKLVLPWVLELVRWQTFSIFKLIAACIFFTNIFHYPMFLGQLFSWSDHFNTHFGIHVNW